MTTYNNPKMYKNVCHNKIAHRNITLYHHQLSHVIFKLFMGQWGEKINLFRISFVSRTIFDFSSSPNRMRACAWTSVCGTLCENHQMITIMMMVAVLVRKFSIEFHYAAFNHFSRAMHYHSHVHRALYDDCIESKQ